MTIETPTPVKKMTLYQSTRFYNSMYKASKNIIPADKLEKFVEAIYDSEVVQLDEQGDELGITLNISLYNANGVNHYEEIILEYLDAYCNDIDTIATFNYSSFFNNITFSWNVKKMKNFTANLVNYIQENSYEVTL